VGVVVGVGMHERQSGWGARVSVGVGMYDV